MRFKVTVTKKQIKTFFYLVLTLLVLGFVGRSLWQGIRQLDWATFRPNYYWIAAAAGAFLCHRVLTGITFSLILRSFGQHIGLARAVSIDWLSGLGQYVPGKIVALTSVVAMLVQSGVRTSLAMTLSAFPMALTTLLGLLCSAPLFLMEPLSHHLNNSGRMLAVILVLLGAITLIPKLFLKNLNFLLRRLHRPEIKAELNNGCFLLSASLVVLRFAMLGLGALCLSRAITDVSWSHYFFFVVALVGSSVVGFLAFFTPAGLGVREGILLLLLGPILGQANAALLVVMIRILQVVIDLIVGGSGIFVLKELGLKIKA